ncbi:MAG: long-chain fatty acid--CoA ligase [Sphingobacteriales bacterium]|nr:MAG: long-chain fatty acid--CoA ligase [Sphingobacteriales bacterium]
MNMQSQRLFDIFLPENFEQLPEEFLRYKRDGTWLYYTPKVLKELSFGLADYLIQKGYNKNINGNPEEKEKVGLICFSRPNWLVVDLATQLTGALLVPLYPNIVASEIVNIFNETGLKICFVGDRNIYNKIQEVRAQIPDLEELYVFDEPATPEMNWRNLITPFSATLEQQVWRNSAAVKGEDVATIIYTSGTTGAPKGVMLSHKNILSNIKSCSSEVFDLFHLDKNESLSFLPMNHILEKMIMYVYLFNNFSVTFAQSVETIAENLQERKPYIFVTVPRLLEKVYEKIIAKGRALKGIKSMLFFWAVRLAQKYKLGTPGSLWYRLQLKIADALIFSKWRAALGGNVKVIVVGGAACQPRLIQIFAAAGINILEGYGLTETSPVISVNRLDLKERIVGTVGKVLDTVQVKILADGEICAKGDNVMVGYYKKPVETAEVIEDGWFKTGDVGELNGRILKITDRKKEIFKTSGGKFVVPQPIENKLKENFAIEQVMLVGEGQKFVAALIVPNFDAVHSWCVRNDVKFEGKEAAIKNEKVLAYFQNIIDRDNEKFNHVEQIRKFILLPAEWTVDGGELTPSLKMKRKAIVSRFQQQINSFYEEVAG